MKYWTRGSLGRGKDTYSCLDQTGRITVLLALATLFSWLGEAIHNAVELPGLTILSLETSIPGIVAALFFGAVSLLALHAAFSWAPAWLGSFESGRPGDYFGAPIEFPSFCASTNRNALPNPYVLQCRRDSVNPNHGKASST